MTTRDSNSWDVFPVSKRHYIILTRFESNQSLLTSELTRTKQDTHILRQMQKSGMLATSQDPDSINGVLWSITDYGRETLKEMKNLAMRFHGVKI